MVGFGLRFIVCVMNQRIQSGIFVVYEADFPKEPLVGVIILRVTSFADVRIVDFNLAIAEVGDLDVSMWHLGFCTQVVVWLKTRAQSDGW